MGALFSPSNLQAAALKGLSEKNVKGFMFKKVIQYHNKTQEKYIHVHAKKVIYAKENLIA